jgi:hypothetical protein
VSFISFLKGSFAIILKLFLVEEEKIEGSPGIVVIKGTSKGSCLQKLDRTLIL